MSKSSVKVLELSSEIVTKHLQDTYGLKDDVQICYYCKISQNRLRQDAGGYYTRTGKRSYYKHYLRNCEVTFLDDEPMVFTFSLKRSENV